VGPRPFVGDLYGLVCLWCGGGGGGGGGGGPIPDLA